MRAASLVRSQQLCDAEIKQLDGPVPGDEDIGGLQVAVDDEVAVCVADPGKNALEQRDPRLDAELETIAVRVDRFTLDILEHEVGQGIVDDPRIDETRDIGMIQPAEHAGPRFGILLRPPGRANKRGRNLIATSPSNRPSTRRASQTLPIPPRPISDSIR